MAIITTYVNDLPLAADPAQFEIPGFDQTTNAGAKALMSSLKGDTGPAPNISITATALPYGSAPVVVKTGTNTAPNFEFRFPLAKDGSTPMFQVANGYIQYRYSAAETWQNLVSLDTLRLHFSDLTEDDIAELQAPALNAAEAANEAAAAATTAAQAANTAAANVKDGKTPVFSGSTATPLAPSIPPTIELTQTGTDTDGNPVYSLTLGIPQGQQGVQGMPPVLVNGTITTGAPGSSVSFTFTYSGTNAQGAPIYRVDGSIPQGAPGAGNGNVEVDASTLEVGKQYVFIPNEDGSPIGVFQELVIPDDQIQADYSQTDTSAKDYIKNKPALATVATSGAYNDLTGRPTLTPSFVTGNTFSATATGVAQTQQVRSIQNGVGTPVVTQLPVATESTAGVMPASAFAQIQENTATIQSIIQGGGKEWPSLETKADLDAFGMPANAMQNDVIKVRDDETHDGATTQYVATDNGSGLEWVFNLIVNFDPVGLATTETPGLKKSSTLDGQTFTEPDGTDSVVGWDALKQRVTNVETGLILKLPSKPDGTTNLIGTNGKVDPVYLPSIAPSVSRSVIITNNLNDITLFEDELIKVSSMSTGGYRIYLQNKTNSNINVHNIIQQSAYQYYDDNIIYNNNNNNINPLTIAANTTVNIPLYVQSTMFTFYIYLKLDMYSLSLDFKSSFMSNPFFVVIDKF